MLKMFKSFLTDDDAYDMYVTGRAGTGKTTSLASLVQYCMDNRIDYVVCAFTHKACKVLRSKLPAKAQVETLHSFLCKCPSINEHAKKREHINISKKRGESDRPTIVFLDEYSMVGEQDYLDIIDMQEPDDKSSIKLCYLGDPYQLPPVGDISSIIPSGKYCMTLTKVHRTDDMDLLNIMTNLVNAIDNSSNMEPIPSSKNVIRDVDIVESYLKSKSTNKQILAFTNKAVQKLNAQIAGRTFPLPKDLIWSSTIRQELVYQSPLAPINVATLATLTGELNLGTKYKTLEFLLKMKDIQFCTALTYNNKEIQIAMVFGSYNYKIILQSLVDKALQSNIDITNAYDTPSAKVWAVANYNKPLARRRAKAWRELITFKSAVLLMDFPFATTIHKSQGSTYEEVYLDAEDLATLLNNNYLMYLKLFYVAISRTSRRFFMS